MTLLEQYKKCMNEFKPLLIGVSEAMYNPILIRMNTKDLNANRNISSIGGSDVPSGNCRRTERSASLALC